jgi:hypothetical protein
MKNSLFLILAVLALFFISCEADSGTGELKAIRAQLKLGEPLYCENLTVIPLHTTGLYNRKELVTLEEALENKWIEINETQGGEVPKVTLDNLSDKRIFVMSGQIITGCKQDRIIARDMIIEPLSKGLDVDVFCVESGRWRENSKEFYSKKNMGTYKLREKAQRKNESSQWEIWDEIADLNRDYKVNSATNAYQDIFEQEQMKENLNKFEEALKQTMDQNTVGVIIGIGNKIKSIDVFGDARMFKTYWPGLLRSSALAAIDADAKGSISLLRAEILLNEVTSKNYNKEILKEKDARYTYLDDKLNICALTFGGNLVHLSAFPVEKDSRCMDQAEEDNKPPQIE